MGRYRKDVQLNQPLDVVSLVMEDFIYHNRFSRTDWNGEMVFYRQDEHGRERYMKWSYAGGWFHVEAWLKNPAGGEMDLDGVGGGKSRREFRSSMDQLIDMLKKQPASSLAGGHVGADPLHHSPDYEAEHKAWKNDPSARAASEAQARSEGGRRDGTEVRAGNGSAAGSAGEYSTNAPCGKISSEKTSSGNSSFGGLSEPGALYGIIGFIVGGMIPILGIVLGVMGMRKSGDYHEKIPPAVKIACIAAIVVSVVSGLWNLVALGLGLTM